MRRTRVGNMANGFEWTGVEVEYQNDLSGGMARSEVVTEV